MNKTLRLFAVTAAMAAIVSTAAFSATTRYEAEAAGNTLVGCITRTADPAWYSGTGFVGDLGESATDVLKFNNVVADVAGSYTLLIGYKTYDAHRYMNLVVNSDAAVRLDCLNGPGGLSSITKTISLNAGTNVIELWATGTWAPDIDYIDVTSDSAVPEPSSLLALGSLVAPLGFLLKRKLA